MIAILLVLIGIGLVIGLVGSAWSGPWLIGGLLVIVAAAEFGPIALVIGVALLALAVWRRFPPPVMPIAIVAVVMAFLGPGSAPANAGGPIGGTLVAGDPFGGTCAPVMTQGYGPVNNDAEPVIGGVHFHTGIDLACPSGTPVQTLTAGRAIVTEGYGGGYGNNVVVEAEGDRFIRYAHLSGVAVSGGAAVRAGDVIGWEGSTGNSTGPHLHFEVDQGAADGAHSVDPASLLTVGR